MDHVNARFAYVNIGAGKDDVYIKTRDLTQRSMAMLAKLSILPSRQGTHPEGRVVEIIREQNRFVGKIEVSKGYALSC